MAEDNTTVTVQILEKTYDIKCPYESVQDLQQAATQLDKKMREIYNLRGYKEIESVAIMAALNFSHELLLSQRQEKDYIKHMGQRLKALQKKVELALTRQEELDF